MNQNHNFSQLSQEDLAIIGDAESKLAARGGQKVALIAYSVE